MGMHHSFLLRFERWAPLCAANQSLIAFFVENSVSLTSHIQPYCRILDHNVEIQKVPFKQSQLFDIKIASRSWSETFLGSVYTQVP